MMQRIILALCCCMAVACGDDGGEGFKARLLGTWVSEHPRYEGCQMLIDAERMVFQAANGALTTYAVSHIHYHNEDQRHLLQLDMTEKGEPAFTMSFYIETGLEGDVLRFKNQPDVLWVRGPS